MSRRPASRRFNGIPMTINRSAALQALAEFPNGTGGLMGVLNGATLATLVAMGLAERAGEDRVGGCRYRITDAGREACA